MANNEVTFDIVERIAVLSKNENWSKEFNIVSWNGASPKYDLRSWSEDHQKMTRGITIAPEEMETIVNAYRDFQKR